MRRPGEGDKLGDEMARLVPEVGVQGVVELFWCDADGANCW